MPQPSGISRTGIGRHSTLAKPPYLLRDCPISGTQRAGSFTDTPCLILPRYHTNKNSGIGLYSLFFQMLWNMEQDPAPTRGFCATEQVEAGESPGVPHTFSILLSIRFPSIGHSSRHLPY